MTIEVPASRPASLPKPPGDAAQCDTLAEVLSTAAARYEEFGEEATRLRDLRNTWWGVAYDAYVAASRKAAPEHSAMAGTVRRVGRAVTSYADTLRDLTGTHDTLVERKAGLDERRTTLIADIEAAAEATPEMIAALQQRATDLGADYGVLVADHDTLQRRVGENEDLLRQAFEAADTLTEGLSGDGGIGETARTAMQEPGAPGSGATPAQVREWWEQLSDAEREAVIAAYPGIIGSADGLPAATRDQANRVLLDDDLARLRAKEEDGTLSTAERRVLANAEAARKALTKADGYVDPTDGERPGGTLWLYDPAAFGGDGRVAVGVGDLDTATDVSVQVPGIMTEMSGVGGNTDEAIRLYESARYNGDGSSVATLFWLGYDTPESPLDPATYTPDRAADGGQRLADAVEGLRASRSDDPAHLTVIGHSYGSTATSYAATDHDLAADDVVLIGSPGAGPADTAADFSVGADHVYDGRNSRDFVTLFGDEGAYHNPGGLGVDPSSEDFGAQRFEAESVDRSSVVNTDDHSRYYDHDSESLYNLGKIVDGHGDEVNAAAHSYDPWYWGSVDPEWSREPTTDVPGRSDTRADDVP
ncbi:hypothetical protein FHP29_15100 [Nocardioides albidus]|uniref:DUF1023 domain-containing protein n=1 Tax=Nocardioides albidus TaxID=1517589 RepID=A0A5C4VTJ0_9ACTN|nr:hypothetical protein FHP29_15100 [Nocardioides albidus]